MICIDISGFVTEDSTAGSFYRLYYLLLWERITTQLSSLKLIGTSKENGFPVVQATVEAESMTGRAYRQFNRQLATQLKKYQDQGMINVILLTEHPEMELPTPVEVFKALKTPEGRFLEEVLRILVIVGFKSKVIKLLSAISSQTTGVKIVLVNTLDEADTVLKVARTDS